MSVDEYDGRSWAVAFIGGRQSLGVEGQVGSSEARKKFDKLCSRAVSQCGVKIPPVFGPEHHAWNWLAFLARQPEPPDPYANRYVCIRDYSYDAIDGRPGWTYAVEGDEIARTVSEVQHRELMERYGLASGDVLPDWWCVSFENVFTASAVLLRRDPLGIVVHRESGPTARIQFAKRILKVDGKEVLTCAPQATQHIRIVESLQEQGWNERAVFRHGATPKKLIRAAMNGLQEKKSESHGCKIELVYDVDRGGVTWQWKAGSTANAGQ
jgi:hypothetical protein